MSLAVTHRSEFADILRQDESFAVADDSSLGNQFNGWFDRLMLQSGIEMSPAMMPAVCLCSALTLGGLVFVLQENLLTTALASLAGFVLPVLVTLVVRSRRQSEMAKQMPPMIDELARAAKTGRSLENCLSMVANDTPHPLGAELRICTRKLALGLNVDEALRDLPELT